MNSLNDNFNYALVTGGTSGIGLAFVHELANRGYAIVLVSNQQEALNVLEKEITAKYGVQCHSLYIDLAKNNAAENVYRFCLENELNIEVLINNAGVLITQELTDVNPQKATELLHLHVLTPTLLCQFFAKDMIARAKGYILTISSTSAKMSYPLISIYGPSKSYLFNFTKALRNELYPKKIHVCGVLPGAVDTHLFYLDDAKKRLAKNLGIMHNPDFIARKGLRALFNNRKSVVPGFFNKLSLVLIRLIPDFIIRSIFKWWVHAKFNKKNSN